jgi:hypothetical protein
MTFGFSIIPTRITVMSQLDTATRDLLRTSCGTPEPMTSDRGRAVSFPFKFHSVSLLKSCRIQLI